MSDISLDVFRLKNILPEGSYITGDEDDSVPEHAVMFRDNNWNIIDECALQERAHIIASNVYLELIRIDDAHGNEFTVLERSSFDWDALSSQRILEDIRNNSGKSADYRAYVFLKEHHAINAMYAIARDVSLAYMLANPNP